MKNQKSAILQMFYGENGNAESLNFSSEVNELIDAVINSYDKLREKIKDNVELLELFKSYKSDLEELHIFEADTHYVEGFKFGLLIGLEAGESKFCK